MNRIINYFIALFFVLFVLVATALSTTGCHQKKQEAQPATLTPTPVPPPGSVVFVEQGHLARLDLDSSLITPLTSGKSTEWFPSCSPKGDQVAYWSNADHGIYNLWKVNMDGSNRFQLTFDDTDSLEFSDQNLLINDSPAWSPDGKKIIYSLAGDIWTIDNDGFNPETLLNGYKALCPSYSPDSKSIIFISKGQDPVYNIWSMNLSDRTPKKLTNYADWDIGCPSFSADGKRIMFNLHRENQTQIYTVTSDGSDALNITNNNRSLCPHFAQNDRKILFCTFGSGEGVGLTLLMANANGTDAKTLTQDNAASPCWAPSASAVVAVPTPVTLKMPPTMSPNQSIGKTPTVSPTITPGSSINIVLPSTGKK